MFNFFKNIITNKKYNLEYASQEFSEELLDEYNKSRPNGPQNKICYAPFKNIYFGHYGKATVCCYNRDFVIGEFPKQSIKEIWESKEANQLRESLNNNNLDFGCHLCKKHILAKNFEANKAKQYDTHQLNKNNYPSVMEFELSNVCNLECTMCNGSFSSLIRRNREGLPPIPIVYNSEFVKQLEEFIPYLEEVKFYGGEPFLIEIYFEIWEKIIELNPSIRISVQTNATILNKRVKSILKKANFHINISIDSLQKETYEKIRINANFERVMKNINWFQEYCQQKDTFFGVSACLMAENYLELPDFVNFCNKHNTSLYLHFVDFPKHKALKSLNKKTLEGAYEYLSKIEFESNNIKSKNNIAHYKDTLKQIQFLIANETSLKKEIGEIVQFKKEFAKQISLFPYLSETEKIHKIQLIENKIDDLAQKVDDKIALSATLKELNFNNTMATREALHIFETKSLNELVEMVNHRKSN